jgi:phage gp29-like protein
VTDPGVLAATTGMKTAVVTAVQNARSIASRENSAQRAELQTIRGQTLAQTAANAANSIGEVFATARAALASTNAGQAAATATANSASRIVAAIYAARPVIQSTTVQKTTTINNRYGETGGSRQSDWSPTH